MRAVRRVLAKHRLAWIDASARHETEPERLFEECQWLIERNLNNYELVEFLGEKLGDDEVLFEAIAPFMNDGFIEMQGEDGHHWRWVFKDGKLHDVPGRVVFDDVR